MRAIITATFAAAMAVAASQAEAQLPLRTREGRVQWAGTGSTFSWYWRNGTSTTHASAGGAYNARIQYKDAKPGYWPAGNVAPTTFGPAVDIFCIDFLHTAKTGTYDAYFTKLSAPELVHTRSSNLVNYLKAAWLTTQMKNYSNTTTSGRRTRAEIHAAIWWIMAGTPASVYDGSGDASYSSNYSQTGRQNWVTAAGISGNYSSIRLNEWTVVTDKCVTTSQTNGRGFTARDYCSQEFLTHNVVPEPATMILLGTGLLATLLMAGIVRRPEA